MEKVRKSLNVMNIEEQVWSASGNVAEYITLMDADYLELHTALVFAQKRQHSKDK